MENYKNIRIKDIAKMADVSVGTVDRVLHQRGKVSDEARKRVEKILEQTGYKPNLLARTLGSNKKLRLVALIPDPRQDEYWKLSQLGVEQAAHEWSHYGVEIVPQYFDLYHNEAFAQVASQVLKSKPDGLLIAPIFFRESSELFQGLKKANIPFVLFNTNISETSPMCFIGQDLYQSGRVAGELLDLGENNGRKKIAALHLYEEVENSVHLKAKETGLRDYFSEKPNNKYEIISLSLSGSDQYSSDSQLLDLLKSNDLHGMMITTSKGAHIAASMLEKLNNHHIRIVGYDLLELNIVYLKKGLIDFLINQNPKRQAQLGISYLANQLLFKKEPPKEELFPLEIITRQNLESYMKSIIH
ncbi:LacI family DNA-binding transcriptional regulator [Flammeovirgaceae bacterium SG7u.111]|nr:LacI family DNA-binding transcriptional regulator [Flammeovirgaceae bacterium SG7u.132]WPO35713.1 LacI family DNA-binding transcriptional regulator [Flammeovirgaceae bacterium SG7u.111]